MDERDVKALNEQVNKNPSKEDGFCVSFKGTMLKVDFYPILKQIDVLKQLGFYFLKHERTENGRFITIDYVLQKNS